LALACPAEVLAKKAKPKSGHQFKGSVEVQYRSNENVSIASSSGQRFDFADYNERDDLDKFNWAVSTGFGIAPKGSRHSFRPTMSYVVLDQDDNEYSSTFVASLGYGYRVSKRLRASATCNYQDKDISSPSAPDARINTLAFGAEFAATQSDIFRFTVAPKVEDSTLSSRNSESSGWEAAYTRKQFVVEFGYESSELESNLPSKDASNDTYYLGGTWNF
jgi:long-subunit fatty acid transport protein